MMCAGIMSGISIKQAALHLKQISQEEIKLKLRPIRRIKGPDLNKQTVCISFTFGKELFNCTGNIWCQNLNHCDLRNFPFLFFFLFQKTAKLMNQSTGRGHHTQRNPCLLKIE